jgi:hypothetical protein
MPDQQSILYLHHPKAKLHNRVLIIARQLMHSLLNIFKIKKSTSKRTHFHIEADFNSMQNPLIFYKTSSLSQTWFLQGKTRTIYTIAKAQTADNPLLNLIHIYEITKRSTYR